MENKIVNAIAKAVIRIAVATDKRMGFYKPYDYETAPFCGHHFSGHEGRFSESSYREGDGGSSGKIIWSMIKAYSHTDEGYHIDIDPVPFLRGKVVWSKTISSQRDESGDKWMVVQRWYYLGYLKLHKKILVLKNGEGY